MNFEFINGKFEKIMNDYDWVNLKEIIRTIENGEINSFIQNLQDSGLDVNTLNTNGRSMLSYAAECGNMEIIKFLVQKGADVNVTDYYGSKPLHTAVKYGHKDIVELFLNSGVFIDSCDYRSCTPLHYLCQETHISVANMEQHLEHARFLIEKKADLNAVDRSGCTPALLASRNFLEDMVKLFLNFGPNAIVCDKSEWSLLHYASRNGWSDIVQSLVERGLEINVNAQTSEGFTPLLLAANSLHKDVVNLLIESGANLEDKAYKNRTVLHYACRNGWLDVVKLLTNKCDLNDVDYHEYTPMLLAAQNSHLSVVDFLIKSGANYECWDEDKWTVLHFACKNEWLDIVRFLVIEKGFTGIKSTSVHKPLNLTAENSHCSVDNASLSERIWTLPDISDFRRMRFPTRKGDAVNSSFSIGDPPLLVATKASNYSVVKFLIESGASIDCCPQGEWTLLHYACKEGWLDIAQALVMKTHDLIKQIDVFRETPLHVAIKYWKLEIIDYLVKVGADYNVESRHGFTAFHNFILSPICLQGLVLFLENGAYFKPNDYVAISEVPLLKQGILQDIKLCSQSLINKFNNADLPKIYELPEGVLKLPSIQKLKIDGNSNVAQDIILSVKHNIECNDYCNVLNVCPIILSILCVRCLDDHYRGSLRQA